jgi:glycosyltransferase involved in cell wall biosynthesis
MPKVSIIVPVYNAEKYLQECVESVLGQTLSDIELILVDDGSTDSSPTLCDQYAAQDRRVKVIHKPNGRAASARNAGLRVASGEYVAFVDADDWISPDMYEKMLQTNADVTLCDYVRFQGEKLFPFTQPNIAAGFYNKAISASGYGWT